MEQQFSVKPAPKLIFGAASVEKLPELVLGYGTQLILVTGKSSFMNSPAWQMLELKLKDTGINVSLIQISGEPSPADIDRATEQFSGRQIDCVAAIGGGSVMDAGKAISAMLKEKQPITQFLEGVGDKEPSGEKLPFIAVPTTSGTGSEATANAVITSQGENGFKKSLRHDNYTPNVALVDPALTLNCNQELTAACGMDTFTQLVEGYLSTNSNIYTDSLAFEGLVHVSQALRFVYDNPKDLPARSGMAYGSYLSGIVLSNAGLGLIHGFASTIGGYYPAPHGVVCGTLMAETNRQTLKKLREAKEEESSYLPLQKYLWLGKMMTDKSGLTDEEYQDIFIEELSAITEELAIPTLGNYGVTAGDLSKIAEEAEDKNSPVELGMKEKMEILISRL